MIQYLIMSWDGDDRGGRLYKNEGLLGHLVVPQRLGVGIFGRCLFWLEVIKDAC